MNKSLPILLLLPVFASAVLAAAEFHVAPSGKDTNPGTAASPFASLEKARDAARQNKGSTVILAAGTYRFTKTLELDARDSGTTFRAAPGAEVRISGSLAVPPSAIKPVADPTLLDRLLPGVRGKVLEIALPNLKPEDFGDIGPRGFRRPYIAAPLEVFIDGETLAISRWPNAGQPGEPIGKVLDKGSVTRNGEKPERGGIFHYKSDRPSRWSKAGEIWITGLFNNGYADNTVRVKSFDLAKKTLTTVHPHMYGFRAKDSWNRWTALNLLEEIDQPGEYSIDRAAGKVFFLPPAGKDPAISRIEVSRLSVPLVAIEGATDVVFDGVTFENSRGMGVYIERGADNRIRNCTLRNLGMVAVCIGKGVEADPDYRHNFTGQPVSRELGSWHEHIYDNTTFDREAGSGHGVVNCHIYNIGAGAISLGGGNRVKLSPAGNFVENCHIHHFNRWDRSYKGAVNLDGVGNIVRHCKIHDAPASALYLHGNEHIIEYNEITRVMIEGNDMGAFYMGRDPTERGNIIRYNYWHEIGSEHNTHCLYFDDAGGDGTRIYGNVFRKAGSIGTVNINNSSDILVTNNLFIGCRIAVRLGQAGFWRTNEGRFEARMKAVGYDQSPWRERYPELLNYLAERDQMPRRNLVTHNLLVNSKINPVEGIESRDNHTLPRDPGQTDPGIPGFVPIPFEKIGLLRKTTAAPAEAQTTKDDQKLGLTTGGSGAWKFYPAADLDPALPRVLLIGDSICNGYRGPVIAALKGKASVDVWLTGAAESSPGLQEDLAKVLKQGPYAVVHFNIGLHGWPAGRIPEGQYEPLMRKYLAVLRQHAPDAKLIWASSTPITVKQKPEELDPVNNPTIVARNVSAARIMQESGIAVNDLYTLVVEKRAQLHGPDPFHWKAPGYELMSQQIVESITCNLTDK